MQSCIDATYTHCTEQRKTIHNARRYFWKRTNEINRRGGRKCHTHTAIPIFDELHTASEPLGPGFMHSQLQTTFPFCRIIQMACPNSEKYFAIALDEQNNNNIGNKPITTPTKSEEYCVWCVCVCQRHFYNWWSLKWLANSSELSWQTHKVVESKSNIDHCVVCSHSGLYKKHTSVNSAHFLMNS